MDFGDCGALRHALMSLVVSSMLAASVALMQVKFLDLGATRRCVDKALFAQEMQELRQLLGVCP